MSWFSGFGSGGASTAAGSATPTTVNVPQYKDGVQQKSFGQGALEEMGKGGGGASKSSGGSSQSSGDSGSGSTLAAKRPIGEHPEAPKISPSDTPARSGFARLAEVGPRQRSYGTP